MDFRDRSLVQLRRMAREIFESALQSVDAREAIRRVVTLDGSILRIFAEQFDITRREIFVVAFGKAAPPMAASLSEILRGRITEGVISGPLSKQDISDPTNWQIFNGGHPLPNTQSLAAAKASFELMQRAEASRAIVIFLVSGGGSAMIEWPGKDNITLDDLRRANSALVSSEATIKEINSIRQAFSAIKGGRLAASAPTTTQVNLIISDVNSGDEAQVASGPTIFPAADSFNPRDVIDRYGLRSALPDSILRSIDSSGSLTMPELHQKTYVLLDNRSALNAAAEKAKTLGFEVEIDGEIVEQQIDQGCDMLLAQLVEMRRQRSLPACLISGGEFRCPVRGDGQGGRNGETALRCAIELERKPSEGNTVVLSGGTDGIDGNSPAAGALADQTTIPRGRAAALDANAFLTNSDSFSFFNQLGDAIVTGPTGTNVRDIRILLSSIPFH